MKKTVFLRRMVFALVNAAAAAVLLWLYTAGAVAVKEFSQTSGLWLADLLYHFAFAVVPAGYLRLLVAWMRRGMYKGRKLQWEVDLAGVAAAVVLVAAGLVGYFLRVNLLAGDVRIYYFTALWLALLCCVQRVPRRADRPAQERSDKPSENEPMPWPQVPQSPTAGPQDKGEKESSENVSWPSFSQTPDLTVPAPWPGEEIRAASQASEEKAGEAPQADPAPGAQQDEKGADPADSQRNL